MSNRNTQRIHVIFTRAKVLLVSVGVLLICIVAVPRVSAAPSDCPDPTDKWFDCWQQFSKVEQYVNSWCSLAPATKAKGQDESSKTKCRNFLLGSINYRPTGLAASERCMTKEVALQKKSCYVVVSSTASGGVWRTALARFGTECGFEAPDRECREREWKRFLDSKGWGPKENPQGQKEGALTDPQDTPFATRVASYLKWLMLGIGLLGAFSLIIAGIQYSAAQGNAQSVAAAKNRIVNVVIGALLYLVMFGMLQWLVPGGIF